MKKILSVKRLKSTGMETGEKWAVVWQCSK